jgi:hypothetical protein
MNTELSDEALEFGRVASGAFKAAGGDELVQQAEVDPSSREHLVAPVLEKLGAWHLEPRAGEDDLEAAAVLCRSAGFWAVPYPVAERLSRSADVDAQGLVVVADRAPSAPLAGVGGRWLAVTTSGRRSLATARSPEATDRRAAFVTPLDLHPLDDLGAADVPLGLVLPCWTLLGMLDRALQLTRNYVLDRKQFGQPLAEFQGLQFQLTDAEVERSGLEELAKYSLWSLVARPEDALPDALALRAAALEAADVVFRVAHQLHGTIGFCDETTVSWLSRYSQPIRRLPLGLAVTREALTRTIGPRGLAGLFDAVAPGA